MKHEFNIDSIYKLCLDLLRIDSPSGDTEVISDYLEDLLKKQGFVTGRTKKDALYAEFPGAEGAPERVVTAHIDTLGGMVSEIMPNGRLRLVNIGGWAYNSIEGENVRIRTAEGKIIKGTVIPDQISIHIFSDFVGEFKRGHDNCSIRLDELTESAEQTRALGIQVGDFVYFETRAEVTESGFIKSRFLDNKINAAVMLEAMFELMKEGKKPSHATRFVFSNFEELGHGVTGLPDTVKELIALDIGTVGGTRNSREDAVTIVAKDSRTPYPFPLRERLQRLAEKEGIAWRPDVHIRYGSDGSLAAIAGMDFNFSCFGPGVEATHHYERTHKKGVLATAELLYAYLTEQP